MTFFTLLPLISGISVIGLGIFVYLSNRKAILNKIFFVFSVATNIWLVGTFLMWTSKGDELIIFWDRFIYIGVVFIPITTYHFGLVLSKIKNQKNLLYFGYFLAFLFLVLSRTNYFMEGLYQYSWGAHTQARFFHHLFLIYFAFYIILFFLNTFKFYKERAQGIEKLQAKYVFFALLILSLGSIAFFPAYGIDVYPVSYFSGFVCAVILAYTATKHHLFNVRVITTELFTSLIILSLLIYTILSPSLDEFLIRGGLFLFVTILGFLLIKSVLKEIKIREKLQVAYQELKKLDNAKSEFLSIASHQLRTPLTAIKGYIGMLQEGIFGKFNKEVENVFEKVYLSNERLIKLVNSLLDISRIEAGRMEFKFKKVQIEEIIEGVVKELFIAAKKKKVYLKFERQKKLLPRAMIDSMKIRQVVLNIIDNSVKYTSKGGVKVSVRLVQNKGKNFCQIAVQDTGIGVPKEELESIFQMYKRGTGMRMFPEGSGLGLYVAKKLIKAHNGRIWVESKGSGKGTSFYIKLPISRKQSAITNFQDFSLLK